MHFSAAITTTTTNPEDFKNPPQEVSLPFHTECENFTSENGDTLGSITSNMRLYFTSMNKNHPSENIYIYFGSQGVPFKVENIGESEIMLKNCYTGHFTPFISELSKIGDKGSFTIGFYESSAEENRVGQIGDWNKAISDNANGGATVPFSDSGNRETLLDNIASSGLFDSKLLGEIGLYEQNYYKEFGADFLTNRIKNPEILAGILFGCLQSVGGRSELGLYGMLGLFGLTMAEGQGIDGAPEFGALLDIELDDTVLEQAWVAATTMTLDMDRMVTLLNSTNVSNRIGLGKMLTALYDSQERMLSSIYDPARECYIQFLDALLPGNWKKLNYQEIGSAVIERLKGNDLTVYDKFLVFSSVLFPYFLSFHIDDGIIDASKALELGYCPLGGGTQREKDVNPNEGKNILWYVLALSTSMMQSGNSSDFVNFLSGIYDSVNHKSIDLSIAELDDQLKEYNQDHNRAVLSAIDFKSPASGFYNILSQIGHFGDIL